MNKIMSFIVEAINLFGKLNLDIEKTPDGKWKICMTIDPSTLKKDN